MANLRMPTQKSVGHDSHTSSINDFNQAMRGEPWYQQFFASQGLDPNHVKLSKAQRSALEQLVLQEGGVPPDAFNDMMIDPAGNLNTEHGFASQPTWLKVLEIAGAGTAAAFGGAAAGGALGAGGGGGTGAGLGASVGAPSALSSSILGGAGAAGGTGAGLAASVGAPAALSSSIGGLGGGAASGVAGGAGIGSKILGGLGKAKAAGLDPTTLALGGMSMLGGDGQPNSYTGKASPQKLLEDAMAYVNAGRKPPSSTEEARRRLPSPISVNASPAPFQIGGGLGRDPAIPTDQAGQSLGAAAGQPSSAAPQPILPKLRKPSLSSQENF